MPRPKPRMTRSEFEALAGIGKTKFFALLDDPAVRIELDYEPVGPGGRAHMDRAKALAFIRKLQAAATARAESRIARFGRYLVRPCPHDRCGRQITRKAGVCSHCGRPVPAATDAPPRGRPCPYCGRRITRKACTCRHCGTPVRAATDGGNDAEAGYVSSPGGRPR